MHISDGPLSTLQQDTARADLAKQVSQCFSSQLKLLTQICLGAASVKGPCSLVLHACSLLCLSGVAQAKYPSCKTSSGVPCTVAKCGQASNAGCCLICCIQPCQMSSWTLSSAVSGV